MDVLENFSGVAVFDFPTALESHELGYIWLHTGPDLPALNVDEDVASERG